VRAAVVALLQADTDGAACRALAKALGVSTERGDDDFAEDAIDQRIADTLLSLAVRAAYAQELRAQVEGLKKPKHGPECVTSGRWRECVCENDGFNNALDAVLAMLDKAATSASLVDHKDGQIVLGFASREDGAKAFAQILAVRHASTRGPSE
jgi:hypothetical protein